MLSKLKNLLQGAKTRLANNPVFVISSHFQDRVLQRFEEEDIPTLEKVIEKAFSKAKTGEKIRYTHPYYNITVVGQKMGLNGFELITCWIKDEDAE